MKQGGIEIRNTLGFDGATTNWTYQDSGPNLGDSQLNFNGADEINYDAAARTFDFTIATTPIITIEGTQITPNVSIIPSTDKSLSLGSTLKRFSQLILASGTSATQTLISNTALSPTAINLTIIGSGAGANITSGNNNTAVGYFALNSDITGTSNTCLGVQSGAAQLTSNGVFIGYRAGYQTSALFTTAVGSSCLSSNTSGASNTALGASAGDTLTTGSFNTCIGRDSDTSANNSIQQIALGYNAICQANYDIQLGERTDPGSGRMYYRTQIVSDNAWIGNGQKMTVINDQGHIGPAIFSTASGSDGGVIMPFDSTQYHISTGTETGPFPFSVGGSPSAGHTIYVRNDSTQPTTGIVVAASGGAIYVYSGSAWLLMAST
jgi:hypothetical protein